MLVLRWDSFTSANLILLIYCDNILFDFCFDQIAIEQ